MVFYYLDTAIWRDYYENRTDRFRPLGEWAHKLLAFIEAQNSKLIVSDVIVDELSSYYSKEEVNTIIKTFNISIIQISINEKQFIEAENLSNIRNIPIGDALHAIIARDNNAIMVTRDHHFEKLTDITQFYKPEDII